MALDDLKEVVEKLQLVIKTYKADYLLGKERRTRQMLIDPLLKVLGWDVLDPSAVYLEHNKMDYALMSNATPVAVIEAKPLGESLEKKAITQAITYAVENTIPYIIVTNGDRWEMYEVFKKADLEDKKLMAFQLSQQLAYECALQALRIWKPNFASGSPKDAMKPVLEFPPDKIEEVAVPPVPAPGPAVGLKPDETWMSKKISAFTFNGETHKVKKWSKFLVKFCEILSKDDTLQFREVLELNPGVFSESRDSFPPWAKSINEIGKTGIYVHTGLNNNDKRDLIKAIVEHFGREMPVPHIDEDG